MTEKRFAIGCVFILVLAVALRASIFGNDYLLTTPTHFLFEPYVTSFQSMYISWVSDIPIFAILVISFVTQMTLAISLNAYKAALPGYEAVLRQALRDEPCNQSQILKDHGFEKILMIEPLIRLITVIAVMIILIKPIILTINPTMPILPWIILVTCSLFIVFKPLLSDMRDWNRISMAFITLVLVTICIYADLFLLLLYITSSNLFQTLNQQLHKYRYIARA